MNQLSKQIVMYSTSWCPDCHRARYLLDSFGIDYQDIDVEENPAGLTFVKKINGGRRVVPTIIFPDGAVLVEPANEILADKLGVSLDEIV